MSKLFIALTLTTVTLLSAIASYAAESAPSSTRSVVLTETQRAALQKENEALGTQIQKLNEKREWAQTEKLVEARWPQLLQEGAGRFFWILPSYTQALQKQGKAEEAALRMQQLSARFLFKMGSADGNWLAGWTADALEQSGENERALRWSKLSWMLAPHQEDKVRESMQRLVRIWSSAGLKQNTGLMLLRSQMRKAPQKTTTATSSTRTDTPVVLQSPNSANTFNALQSIILPRWKDTTIASQLKLATQPQERITIYLANNDFVRAANEAKKLDSSKPESALEICRILRAYDGDLYRANAFVVFAKSGAGLNPFNQLQNELRVQQEKSKPKQTVKLAPPSPKPPQTFSAYPTPTPVPSPTPWVRRTPNTTSNNATSSTRSSTPLLMDDGVQPIRSQAAVLPVTIALIRADLMTAENAYAMKALTLSDIEELATANHSWSMGDWGRIEGIEDATLRREVMSVLWNRDPRFKSAGDKTFKTVNPRVRLWVGDMLYKRNDERCVPILNGILDEVKVPVKGESPLLFSTVERLAWFHRNRGEYAKAINAWMKMEKVHADKGWYVGDAYLESARLALQMGDAEKAKTLYAQVANRGVGFVNQVALVDQANLLISQKKYQQASALILPVVAQNGGGQARVPLLAVLGQSYLAAGDFSSASKYFKQAIAEYKPGEDDGGVASSAMFVNTAREGLVAAERWSKTTFDVPLKSLLATRDTQGTYRAKLYVHSFSNQTVNIAFTSASAKPVALKQISQRRTDSLVVVSVYDLAFRVSKSSSAVKAKVFLPTKPQMSVPIEVRLQSDDE